MSAPWCSRSVSERHTLCLVIVSVECSWWLANGNKINARRMGEWVRMDSSPLALPPRAESFQPHPQTQSPFASQTPNLCL